MKYTSYYCVQHISCYCILHITVYSTFHVTVHSTLHITVYSTFHVTVYSTLHISVQHISFYCTQYTSYYCAQHISCSCTQYTSYYCVQDIAYTVFATYLHFIPVFSALYHSITPICRKHERMSSSFITIFITGLSETPLPCNYLNATTSPYSVLHHTIRTDSFMCHIIHGHFLPAIMILEPCTS